MTIFFLGGGHTFYGTVGYKRKPKHLLCDGQQNAAFSIAPLAMTSELTSSVDFTFPFYRSRVVAATTRRSRHTGWSSGRLGRPLTTSVWVAAGAVVVAVGLLIGVAGYCGQVLDVDQPTSVHGDATSSAVSSTSSHTTRRRRLKNAFRSREFR